jgi:hypothetical protein
MTKHCWLLISCLTMQLQTSLIARGTADAPIPLGLENRGMLLDLAADADLLLILNGVPVVRAPGPLLSKPLPPRPAKPEQKLQYERDAAVPEPRNGWELVERAITRETRELPSENATSTPPLPWPVTELKRLGPNFVLPTTKAT